MRKQLKLLLVDFDGVLSNGRFYQVSDSTRSKIGEAASAIIFDRQDKTLVHQWMRGELAYADVHDVVANQTGIDARLLDSLLEESVKYMPLNPSLLRFISLVRSRGVAVSLFTNNMDIFDTVSRHHHRLDDHFDYIYSSSRYGQLKFENDTLLQLAASEAGVDMESIALVDDSHESFARASEYGVNAFIYKEYEASQFAFERWLEHEYQY